MRFNPLKGEWVLVCPHRMKRPWQGQVSKPEEEKIPSFDPKNPLCPGVQRVSGKVTPNYESTYVFENDFCALLETGPEPGEPKHELLRAAAAKGTCRVICFHPRSDVTVSTMSPPEIRKVIDEWANQIEDLGKRHMWVQIFENRGKMVGCSNPHPHCQIWSCDFMPNEGRKSDENQKAYYQKHGRPLLLDYIKVEQQEKTRIIVENDHWIVIVPFWACWPYETIVIPKRHVLRLPDLTNEERDSLASIMKRLLTRYDNVFQVTFPYLMGWHGAPTGRKMQEDNNHWQLHALYYPPLLKSATVRKFLGGFENFAQVQRDLSPEKAAENLQRMSEVHYKDEQPSE